jgi:hypothetical protein
VATPSMKKKWWLALLILLVAIAVIVIKKQQLQKHRECPHDWSQLDSLDTNHQLTIPGVITNVPEYHDCQRFLLDNSGAGKYGALEAIFVLDSITEKYAASKAVALSDRDLVVLRKAQNPVIAQYPGPVPLVLLLTVAEVYSEGDYEPLGIKQGFDCIEFLWVIPGNATTYSAWMVPVAKESECGLLSMAHPWMLGSTVTELEVDEVKLIEKDKVPPAARWQWDPTGRQYIGLKCPGELWCALHKKGDLHQTETYNLSTISPPPQIRLLGGWGDAQYLAKYTGTWPFKKLERDGPFGTLFAARSLDGRTLDDYTKNAPTDNHWLPVASVALDGPTSTYGSSLNFEPTPANLASLNQVELCFNGNGVTCEGGNKLPPGCKFDNSNNGTWYARVIASNSHAIVYYCVDYQQTIVPSTGKTIQPPGMVRWRWLPNDETIWVSCPSGCCQVKPKGQ